MAICAAVLNIPIEHAVLCMFFSVKESCRDVYEMSREQLTYRVSFRPTDDKAETVKIYFISNINKLYWLNNIQCKKEQLKHSINQIYINVSG